MQILTQEGPEWGLRPLTSSTDLPCDRTLDHTLSSRVLAARSWNTKKIRNASIFLVFCWFHQLTETHTKFLACLLSSKLSLLLFARPPRHWCLPYTLCRCLGGAGKRCPFAQGSPSRWGSSKGGSLLCLLRVFSKNEVSVKRRLA